MRRVRRRIVVFIEPHFAKISEDEGTLGLHLALFPLLGTLAKLCCDALQLVLVEQTEVLGERGLGVGILRCGDVHLHLGLHVGRDGHLVLVHLGPSLASDGVAQRTVVEEDEVVERIALE